MKGEFRLTLTAGVFWLLCLLSLRAQTVGVPLSHWAYPVLERWEVRGLVDGVFNGSRPFTRLEMAEYIKKALEKREESPERFSGTELQQLAYLTVEFREELEKLGWKQKIPPLRTRVRSLLDSRFVRPLSKWFYLNNRNFLTFQHREFTLYLDPVLSYSYENRLVPYRERGQETPLTTAQARVRTSNGLLFRGSLGRHIGFYFALTDNHVTDDLWGGKYLPYEVLEGSGQPYILRRQDGSYDFDENLAQLTVRYKYFYLLFGRDYNQWGVGHHGNLMLSTNAPVYDQIKLVVRYWRFKFTHISAFLQYISPQGRVSVKEQPYLPVYWAGNRLELNLGRGWQLGLSEAVVYGDRPVSAGYSHPLGFFASLEHFYGDRDNASLGIDLEWRMVPGIKVFGEWFIDDITTGKLGSNFFGNKFGLQGGFWWANPFSLSDVDLLGEYTRVKPYVYSHSVHDYNKYKHYDTILGHFIGPNSDNLYLRLEKRFSKFLALGLDYERYRHGSNPPDRNVGGDVDRPHRDEDPREAPFLDGIRQTITAGGVYLRYEFLRNLFLEASYRRAKYNQYEVQNLVNVRVSFNFGYRKEKNPSYAPVFF